MVAPNLPPHPHHADIDRVFMQAIAQKMCSGAAAMMSLTLPSGNHIVVHREVYGRTHDDVYKGTKLARDSLFDVGELTFCLGPVLLTLLWCAATKLDIRRPLGLLLPQTQHTPLKDITVTQLLDHTSGLSLAPEIVTRVQAMAPAPPRVRHHAVDETVVHTPRLRSAFAADLPAPIDEPLRNTIRALLLQARPIHPPGSAVHPSPLNAIVLGFVLESLGHKPLHELLEREVYAKLHVTSGFAMPRNGISGLHPRKIGSQSQGPALATLDCPWRRRVLVGETSDPLAWLWGGLMGHSGLFATLEGVHALMLGLLEAYQGRSQLVHAGTLKRFWTRSQQVAQATTTLGFAVPCRDNGMHQSRWPMQSIGQVAREGQAVFVDLMGGTIGVVLTNLTHPTATDKDEVWRHLRLRAFDAMAAVADEVRRRPPKPRPQPRGPQRPRPKR